MHILLRSSFPDQQVALVLGFANLLADGFSMAVSNYEAGLAFATGHFVQGL